MVAKKSYVQTKINGETVEFLCEPRQSLLECLRDVLQLTGSKEGCNDGNCGACTVKMDGRIVKSKVDRERTIASEALSLHFPPDKCCIYENEKLV